MIIYVVTPILFIYLILKVRKLEEIMDRQEVEHNEMKVSLDRLHEKLDQLND
ncbi:hypothetical protein [Halobacillus litoralis]|uniref:hypothetical protein n=1 Tax=Halobacillus litoralis TaxID=45668 RepID=UPI001CFD1362|nr:hypothetical protein [Halobacillus litoralis]